MRLEERMDRSDVERWIADYRKAWASDAPDDIGALFTEDATYSPYPFPRERIGWEGRDEIIRKWIGRGDSKIDWKFEHEILAVDGDTAVIQGWTSYGPRDGDPPKDYANIWLVRFADDGRASRFAELWVERPQD
jgi:ketosteroid isomerase-like protein